MITQKDLKASRFFTIDGTDIWRVVETRVVTEVKLRNVETAGECTAIVDADYEPFLPIIMPTKKQTKPARPASFKKKRKTIKHKVMAKPGTLARRKKSRYKGVKVSKKPYADGRTRYEVNYYDPATKKVKFLGCFDDELQAAATYADREGNKAEAARLRAMAKQQKADDAEQAENNPDRPTRTKGKKKSTAESAENAEKIKSRKVKGKKKSTAEIAENAEEIKSKKAKRKKVAYKCTDKACGLEWQSKPSCCPGCYGKSFKIIEVES